MFQLSQDEFESLRLHFGTSNSRGGRRYPPFAFTEHGVTMLSSVVRSPPADGPAREGAVCPRCPDERLPLSLLPVPAAPSGFRVEEGRLGVTGSSGGCAPKAPGDLTKANGDEPRMMSPEFAKSSKNMGCPLLPGHRIGAGSGRRMPDFQEPAKRAALVSCLEVCYRSA